MKKITFVLSLLLLTGIAMAKTTTVTITVIDGSDYVSPVSGATVDFEGNTSVTAGNGKVQFIIPTPETGTSYAMKVTAPDYVDFLGDWFYIDADAATAEFDVYIKKAYTVSFTVLDKNGNAVEGAEITVGDLSGTTTAEGTYSFVKQFPSSWSPYEFVISATGYADYKGSFSVSGDDLAVEPLTLQLAYNLTVTVKESHGTPLEGAEVTINNEVLTTNSEGQVVIHKLIDGEYSYQVYKLGFQDVRNNLSIEGSDASSEAILPDGHELTLTIFNGPQGPGLPNDTVTIGNITKISDFEGKIRIGVGTDPLNFIVKKTGFLDVPVSITSLYIEEDTIIMIPDYTVRFSVYDASSSLFIQGAKINFNGEEYLSDENGMAVIEHVSPSLSDYTYSVSAEGGYFLLEGTVSLPYSSTFVESFNMIDQYIGLVRPGISIGLVNGWITYYGQCQVVVDGKNYEYIAPLGSARVDLPPGTYRYKVIPEDITKAILKGELTITESGTDYLSLDVVDGFKADFFAVNTSSDPIQGAELIFNGDTVLTGESGDASFERVPGAEYHYSLRMDGYQPILDKTITIVTADVLEIATLLKYYRLTFHITDGSNPIEGALVELGEQSASSLADGSVVFENVPQGTWPYTVSKQGFLATTGEAEVADMDINKDISLLVNSIDGFRTGEANLYPNPAHDLVYISLPGVTGSASLTIRSMDGKILRSLQTELKGKQATALNLQDLSKGIYLVSIRTSEAEYRGRLIKE